MTTRTGMSAAERLRRVRALAAQAREVDRLPKNCPYDIGLRTTTIYLMEPPGTSAQCYAPDDDLLDMCKAQAWAKGASAGDGEVVHLYFYWPGDYGQLVNTITGWIGTAQHAPMLVSVPGHEIGLD